MKIRIFLLAILLAGIAIVPMVNAADDRVQRLPEPQQVPMDEKALKEMQKEIVKELQASTAIDDKEKRLLIKQLKENGRLILPLGSTTYFQTLTLLIKKNGKTDVQHLLSVSFVPMTGEAQKR